MQNRGHAFSLDAKSANRVAPGKRPFHTIIPAFLTKDGKPVMSYGVMGANMQPQGHMQTLVRMLDYGQNPQAACDAPRWRYNTGLNINVEAAMNGQTVQGLIERGHQLDIINASSSGAWAIQASRVTWPPATRAGTDRRWVFDESPGCHPDLAADGLGGLHTCSSRSLVLRCGADARQMGHAAIAVPQARGAKTGARVPSQIARDALVASAFV
jgi:hypothetical protein